MRECVGRLPLRLRESALGRIPRLEPGQHSERERLGPQYSDVGGNREGGAPPSDHRDAEAIVLPESPKHAPADAADDGAGGELELDESAGSVGGSDEGLISGERLW